MTNEMKRKRPPNHVSSSVVVVASNIIPELSAFTVQRNVRKVTFANCQQNDDDNVDEENAGQTENIGNITALLMGE